MPRTDADLDPAGRLAALRSVEPPGAERAVYDGPVTAPVRAAGPPVRAAGPPIRAAEPSVRAPGLPSDDASTAPTWPDRGRPVAVAGDRGSARRYPGPSLAAVTMPPDRSRVDVSAGAPPLDGRPRAAGRRDGTPPERGGYGDDPAPGPNPRTGPRRPGPALGARPTGTPGRAGPRRDGAVDREESPGDGIWRDPTEDDGDRDDDPDRDEVGDPMREPRSARDRSLSGPHGRFARLAARWLPAPMAARLDPGRPGAVALVLVVLVAAVVAAAGVWWSRPQAQPVAALPAVSAPETPGTPGPAATPGGAIVVSVVGKVVRPGLVRVQDGARVADALDAVGGALPGVDVSTINLARRVADGEQVAIGVPPAPDAAPAAPSAPGPDLGAGVGQPLPSGSSGASAPAAGAAGPGGKVNLNQATADQLDALPGVGPATAAKILDWRNRNGRFARVDQLREVDGIGERRYAQLSGLVTV